MPGLPNSPPSRLPVVKGILFLLALIPLARLIAGALTDGLGANPIEFITRDTGTWTFNFLLLTLTVTPLRLLTGWHVLLRLRRMLGLFTFFYAVLHFTTYLWLDQFFDLDSILRDILKRPFITVGFAAFVLLWPLALTSNAFAIRRLGGKRWQTLHRAVYLIALLACVHYFWLVKAVALMSPLIYAALVAVLLGDRARRRLRQAGPWPGKTPARTRGVGTLQTIRIYPTRPPAPGR